MVSAIPAYGDVGLVSITSSNGLPTRAPVGLGTIGAKYPDWGVNSSWALSETGVLASELNPPWPKDVVGETLTLSKLPSASWLSSDEISPTNGKLAFRPNG